MEEVKYPKELALLDKYLCGDKKAGEELFGTAYPSVRKYIFSNTKAYSFFSESDKEDMISDAMMRAIDDQHLYNGSSKFQSFIIGYAKYIIMEQRRKKAKELSKIVDINDIICLESIDIFDNPLVVVIEKEQIEAVRKSLELLPEEHRTILTLRLFNEMPFKQLATLVGKSDDAVDSLFRRALKAFINNFEKIYNGATDF